jgi:hypothetical protein
MNKYHILILLLLSSIIRLNAQVIDLSKIILAPVQVSMSKVELDGHKAIRVTKDTTVKKVDEASFVRVNDISFQDGVIEVKLLSRLLPTASPQDRGFIGIAFRISEANDRFECIYIRPTNGRAEQQLRRNRSTQYFSFPDYKFDRLRKEAPGEYESYADMGLNEWITLRIEVKGAGAKLFINNNPQPALVVNDLKHGAGQRGAIGLFVDQGTEGFFEALKVSHSD